jgi:hypothetical protein
MKTIEEAANEYSASRENNDYTIETEMAFNAGVEFAQQWISVEDEMPNSKEIILVKSNLNCYGTAYCHGKESGFILYGDDAYIRFGIITHWRPIERK